MHFLLRPRLGRTALLIMVVLAGVGLAAVIGARLQLALLQTHEVPSVDTIRLEHGAFNALAILTAALVNIVGSLVLIGGALQSAYSAWRRGGAASRLMANVLIALGAFIVAGASTLTRFHVYELFYVGQAVGVLVMFSGFLSAQRAPRAIPRLKTVPSR